MMRGAAVVPRRSGGAVSSAAPRRQTFPQQAPQLQAWGPQLQQQLRQREALLPQQRHSSAAPPQPRPLQQGGGATVSGEAPAAARSLRTRAQTRAEEPVHVSTARLEQLLEAEITSLALRKAHPLELQQILDMAAATDGQLARLLHEELPVRFAQRIRMLESLPRWQDTPGIASVRRMYVQSFKELRLADPEQPEQFQMQLRNIKQRHSHTNLLVNGFRHYAEVDNLQVGDINEWLDHFFSLRVSTNMLMSHYLQSFSTVTSSSSMKGMSLDFDPEYDPYLSSIDPQCNPARIARHAAHLVDRMCSLRYGRSPRITVKDSGARAFSFVPRYLFYIFSELLKNSVRATVEQYPGMGSEDLPPVEILICGDEVVCSCRISDQGGGIPVESLDKVWSYFYTTADRIDSPVSRGAVDAPADLRWLGKRATEMVGNGGGGVSEEINSMLSSPLAGLGCGLPLSRLYASYLGGSVQLQTLPKHGTDAFIYLNRLAQSTHESAGWSKGNGGGSARAASKLSEAPGSSDQKVSPRGFFPGSAPASS